MNAAEFLDTITDELLSGEDVASQADVRGRLDAMEQAIQYLEAADVVNPETLLAHQGGEELAAILLGVPKLQVNARMVLDGLSDWRAMTLGESLRAVVVGLLVADAQVRKGLWRRGKFEAIAAKHLEDAVGAIGSGFRVSPRSRLTFGGRTRQFQYVITRDSKPIAAVAAIFQTTSGGRQIAILNELPGIQRALADDSVSLFVVADGSAFRTMSSAVNRVLPQLQFVTNIRGLLSGALSDFIRTILENPEALAEYSSEPDERFTAIVEAALRAGDAVDSSLLGTSEARAQSFLARYALLNKEKNLEIDSAGVLSSPNLPLIRTIRQRGRIAEGDQPAAVRILSDWLNWQTELQSSDEYFTEYAVSLSESRLRLPDPMPLFLVGHNALSYPFTTLDRIDRRLVEGPLVSRMAIVITPLDDQSTVWRTLARSRSRRAQFIFLLLDDVAELLLRNRQAARDFFLKSLIRNVDLSLVSPFQSEGPIPEPMFYGRKTEIQRIMEHIRHQSFSLMGGRKVGKTSILRRVYDLLRSSYPVEYLDCQAVPDRSAFLAMLLRQKNGKDETRSGNLIEAQLNEYLSRAFGDGYGILLMDEVDQLFWSDAVEPVHPHVLSSALRAAVQSSRLSIIVTGERSIFRLTRNPESPHWNFCTPLQIGPLDAVPAKELLAEPLNNLGLSISQAALDAALERTGLHPNLIQYLGELLVAEMSDRRRAELDDPVIQDQTISEVTRRPEYQDRFVKTYWSQATPLERWISLSLSASASTTPDAISRTLANQGKQIPAGEIEDALQFLQLYFIVEQRTDGYAFRSNIFDEYFAPMRDSIFADEWLASIGK